MRAEGMHLTLQFLGDLVASRARLVARVMDEVAAEYLPFTLDLLGLGAFPKASQAKTLWVGVRSGGEILNRLQRELEDRLIRVGFGREGRGFEPHVTLARFHDPRTLRRMIE